MDKGFIQIEDERFSTHIALPLWPNKRILVLNLNMLLWRSLDSLHIWLCFSLLNLSKKCRSSIWSLVIRLSLVLRFLLLLLLHHLLLLDLLLLKGILSSRIGRFSSRIWLLLRLSSLLTLLGLLLFLKLHLLLLSLWLLVSACSLHLSLNLVLILLMVRHDLALLLDTSSAWVTPFVHTVWGVGSLSQVWLVWLTSIGILFLLLISALIRSFPLTVVACILIRLFSHGVFGRMIFGRFWVVHTVTNMATRCWLPRNIGLFQRDFPLVYASLNFPLVLRRHLLLFGVIEAISLELVRLDLQFLAVVSSISYLLLLLLLPSLYILHLLVLSVAIMLLSLAVLLAHVGYIIGLETQRVVAVDHAVWLVETLLGVLLQVYWTVHWCLISSHRDFK